jgi:hypothetical protein
MNEVAIEVDIGVSVRIIYTDEVDDGIVPLSLSNPLDFVSSRVVVHPDLGIGRLLYPH